MKPTIKPSELIKLLESDDGMLAFRLEKSQVLIWPLVRHSVISVIIRNKNGMNKVSDGINRKPGLGNRLKTFTRAIVLNPFRIRKRKIIFFNSGITNVKMDDGKYFNRITDYFHFIHPKESVLIEDAVNNELYYPRVHNHVFAHMPLFLLSASIRKFFTRLTTKDISTINDMVDRLQKEITFPVDGALFDEIRNKTIDNCRWYKASFNVYKFFLKLKKPKLIFVEDGSYGYRSFIIKAANDLHIPTAELQHGFINEEHFAYNVGQGLSENAEFKSYFPRYLLMYGEFCSASVNTLSSKVIIGNPYLENKVKDLALKADNKILFLSSAVTVKETVDFLTKLLVLAGNHNMKVYFRPHPFEKEETMQRYGKLFQEGLILDENQNLYDSFADVKIVIGEISTALFEAAAVKDRIFLFCSSFTKTYFSEHITFPHVDCNNIEVIFSDNETTYKKVEKEYYWSNNWEENYKTFIANVIKNSKDTNSC